MKILFINSLSFDYLQDLCFSGLMKLVGSSSIVHWPANRKFIVPLKQYPKNIGFRKDAWRTAGFFIPKPSEFDLVILASCHPDAFRAYIRLASHIPASVPTVFIDGGDFPEIGGDLQRLGQPQLLPEALAIRDFDHVFKREYLLDVQFSDNVYPLPLAFNFSMLPTVSLSEKKYEVTFWATQSAPIRTEALQLLQDQFDCYENGTRLNQTFNEYPRKGIRYLEELSASRIALNFRGTGWDTLRYWEIPATGSFMISQRPGIRIPNNFNENEHLVFCNDNLEDLLDKCKYFLDHAERREAMARAAFAHAHKYHSDVSRAQTILDVIRRT